MKGQVEVLEEMLVFAVAFVVVFNLLLFMRKLDERIVSSSRELAMQLNAERVADYVVKAAVAGRSSFLMRLQPYIGNDIYRISMDSGPLGLLDTRTGKSVSPPLFMSARGEITEFSPGEFFVLSNNSAVTMKRVNIAEFI